MTLPQKWGNVCLKWSRLQPIHAQQLVGADLSLDGWNSVIIIQVHLIKVAIYNSKIITYYTYIPVWDMACMNNKGETNKIMKKKSKTPISVENEVTCISLSFTQVCFPQLSGVVRPAKTQISLGIRPVWSESSLSAWSKLGSLATHWAHFVGLLWDGSFLTSPLLWPTLYLFVCLKCYDPVNTVLSHVKLFS